MMFFFITALSYFSLHSCSNSPSYPTAIEQAIELFYYENQNDSVLAILETKDFTNKRFANIKQALRAAALCEKGEVDAASELLTTLNIESSDKVLLFWRTHIKGLILFRENELSKAYETLMQAISLKSIDMRANALSERLIARILFTLGRNNEGIEWMIKSSEHFQKMHLEKSIAINEKILGRYYMNIGNRAEAFHYFKKSEKILRKYNDVAELFYIYINLLDYHLVNNDLKRANQYAEQCLSIIETYNNNQMKALIYNNIGEIHLMQQKPDEAEAFFQKTIRLPLNYSGARIRVTRAYLLLSKIYEEKGEKNIAIKYALKAKALYKGLTSYPTWQHKVYNQLMNLYTQTDNNQPIEQIKDSIDFYSNAIKEEQIQLSKDIYDTKTELLQTNNIIQQLKSKAKSRLIIATVVIIAFFVSIAGFILFYHSSKIKTEALRSLVQKNLEQLHNDRNELNKIKKRFQLEGCSRKKIDRKKTDYLFIEIMQWLEENDNFTRNDVTIDTIANTLNSNRDYVSQAINAKGLRFNELINKLRINKTMEMLSNPQHPLHNKKLTHIALEVGFNHASTFYEAFKKQTGMTPSQFRSGNKS